MQEGRVEVRREARYFADAIGEARSPVWVVFHGYCQTADSFLREARPLIEEEGGRIVAPEGLSRLYRRSGRGEIGASWMTRVMREEEIDEYVALISVVLEDSGVERSTPLNLLGFSQGAATAMRYALRGGRPIETCVLWGAGFEPAELREYRDDLAGIRQIVLVSGDSDRIVSSETIERTATVLADLGQRPLRLDHAGGHELDRRILGGLARL